MEIHFRVREKYKDDNSRAPRFGSCTISFFSLYTLSLNYIVNMIFHKVKSDTRNNALM